MIERNVNHLIVQSVQTLWMLWGVWGALKPQPAAGSRQSAFLSVLRLLSLSSHSSLCPTSGQVDEKARVLPPSPCLQVWIPWLTLWPPSNPPLPAFSSHFQRAALLPAEKPPHVSSKCFATFLVCVWHRKSTSQSKLGWGLSVLQRDYHRRIKRNDRPRYY